MTWVFCQVMTVWLYFWSSFVKEMHTYFGIPDIVVEAAHSLDHLCMNSDDQIATYNIAFLQYSTMLQWTENTLCHRYYFGLPDRIQDIISTHEGGKPSTFWSLFHSSLHQQSFLGAEMRVQKGSILHSAMSCISGVF